MTSLLLRPCSISNRQHGSTLSNFGVPPHNLFRTVSLLLPPHTLSPSSVKVKSLTVSSLGDRLRFKSVRCAAQEDENIPTEVENPLEVKATEGILPPGWPPVGLMLFGLGFLLGPPLDGIHSRVQLQLYDSGAINIFGLETNIWVPPLLGVFYSVVGLIQLALDRWLAPKGKVPQADAQKVVASFVTLAILLELSAEMYTAGVPFNIEAYILFASAELNWLLFENTWWGFALACVVGLGCPLAEIPLLKLFGLWHYPKANVYLYGEGIITWVVCCYFFYTPFIGNLARWLSSYVEKGSIQLKQRRTNP